MHRSWIPNLSLAASMLVVLTAAKCDDGTVRLSVQDCTQFPGRYKDPAKTECGLTPQGIRRCHRSIVFQSNGQYVRSYSDLSEHGFFTCREDGIYVRDKQSEDGTGPNQGKRIDFDPVQKTVTWHGVVYYRNDT